MKHTLRFLAAALLAVSCAGLAACQQATPSGESPDTPPILSEAPAPAQSPALSTVEFVRISFEQRQAEAQAEVQAEAAPCPDCGLNTLRVVRENYHTAETGEPVRCQHGGFPFLNDYSLVRSGTRVFLCDCCGLTYEETVTDEHIRYCPFLESAY